MLGNTRINILLSVILVRGIVFSFSSISIAFNTTSGAEKSMQKVKME